MIDRRFIAGFESWRTTGYVPRRHGRPLGESGVTVCDGVDLGSMAPAQLDGWPLPPALAQRLRPYCGLRGAAAMALLASRPLILTDAEALALSSAAGACHVAELRALYDAAVAPGRRGWADLSDAQQTVIFSVAWQYGVHLAKACPRFWRAVVAQDWPAAVAELRDFGDAYPTRRNAEADLLSA